MANWLLILIIHQCNFLKMDYIIYIIQIIFILAAYR
jgi:hypothetical protein